MNLGFIILLASLLPEANFPLHTAIFLQAQASQPQAEAGQKPSESKPPEQAPSVPAKSSQEAEPTPPVPPQANPVEPEGEPEAKPPDQAPQPPPSSEEVEKPVPITPIPESKPSKVAAPSAKAKTTQSQPATKKKKKKRRKGTAHASGPRKVIVRDGGTAETISQLAPDMSTEDASHARENTTQLLASAEANLRQAITRQLTIEQRGTIEQIRSFMDQSNAAVKAGDLQRGHNLALKALLLSNDLVKH